METKKLYMKPLAERFEIDDDDLMQASWHPHAKEDIFSESSSVSESTPTIFTDPISSSSDEYSMQ